MPVFEGKFRITQDVTIGFSKAGDGVRALLSSQKNVAIAGELRYQACTSTLCYPLQRNKEAAWRATQSFLRRYARAIAERRTYLSQLPDLERGAEVETAKQKLLQPQAS